MLNFQDKFGPNCCGGGGGTTPVSDCNSTCHPPLRPLNCTWTFMTRSGGQGSVTFLLNHYPTTSSGTAWSSDPVLVPSDYLGAGTNLDPTHSGINCYYIITMTCIPSGGFSIKAVLQPGGTNCSHGSNVDTGIGPYDNHCTSDYHMRFPIIQGTDFGDPASNLDNFDLS